MTSEFDLCRAYIEPDDAARALERLPTTQVTALVEVLAPAAAARVLDAAMPAAATECLSRLAPGAAAAVLVELRADRAAVLMRGMDEAVRVAILQHVPEGDARVLQASLRYPAGTAGALMDLRVVSGRDDLDAGRALALLRRSSRYMLDYFYVVDGDHHLIGVVRLRDLMAARPSDRLAVLMQPPANRVSARASLAAVLAHPGWRRDHALPVVDEASVLVGAISYETYRALEDQADGRGQPDSIAAVFALGELYWLGLSGVVDGLASALRRPTPRTEPFWEKSDATH